MACSTILRATPRPRNSPEVRVLLRSGGGALKAPTIEAFPLRFPSTADHICVLGVKTVNTKRLKILTVLVLGTVGLAPADACSCAPPGAPCAEYWRLWAVFAGNVG